MGAGRRARCPYSYPTCRFCDKANTAITSLHAESLTPQHHAPPSRLKRATPLGKISRCSCHTCPSPALALFRPPRTPIYTRCLAMLHWLPVALGTWARPGYCCNRNRCVSNLAIKIYLPCNKGPLRLCSMLTANLAEQATRPVGPVGFAIPSFPLQPEAYRFNPCSLTTHQQGSLSSNA